MKILETLIVLAVSVLFLGCSELQTQFSQLTNTSSANTNTSKYNKPDWILTPCQNDKIGGVGISGIHIKGPSAQRELAISRAVDEIARQLGVKVSNILKMSTVASGSSASTTMESYSFQTVDGKTVSASIAGIWNDPSSDELYVWMLTSQKQ